ncbi:alpha,alpha-trehalose-phosphate synthase (UDP-forming) [Silvibacterium dinghuense]|uniref:Trehalose-6-phosphate synthase n=1 Tax=Silvibacterium dinghuense TaxID=1560006 RepID=A0A4Q1SJ27_9BACT|nr:trehalose-6-phosphate synthase [Silvibacterium dinghuense]RXS97260.1 trehalose-6-phosphate synthase [Silvibacterium dinghuense]GGG97574.1 trehalose-6-phosphate synthase [Silvibacterium dinghuense]
MRILSLRLIVALVFGVTLVSVVSSWYQVRTTKDALRLDLERKAETFSDSLAVIPEPYLQRGDIAGLLATLHRFDGRDHLIGTTVYDRNGFILANTGNIRSLTRTTPQIIRDAIARNSTETNYMRSGFRRLYIVAAPIPAATEDMAGGILVVYDTDYIRAQVFHIWIQAFAHIALQVLVIVAITLLIVRWSLVGPIARAAEWMKRLRTDRHAQPPSPKDLDFLSSLAKEVAPLAESMRQARAAAEIEASLRNRNESVWTAQRLADHVRNKLGGSNLFVVSNREPYIHSRQDGAIKVTIPASGLVTAIEPILCACNGTWIAQGSGNADREVVDSHDCLQVPPEDPKYTLRRVWLTKEEEEGYYYGFANEGLWPLCHMAHTRPVFRTSDWSYYNEVNARFADALVEQIADEQAPVVLIQDYHFALLPRMIKERLPHARVAIFWHIPWPNPESFSICPWQQELLDGLLGADLIGFHVQAHCNNFLNTVDRVLEAQVDWERFSVRHKNHWSSVLPFPISVDFLEQGTVKTDSNTAEERSQLIAELGIETTYLGVGVDRLDYTKGIVERFLAVESFLERHPRYQGRFTFIQIGAPTRSNIPQYANFQRDVENEAARINERFGRGRWKPIVLLSRQHSHKEVERYYRLAHLCMVTSLHDGMNLVSKEFIATRDDLRGVLILSLFTGASRELRDAIIVNPYDTEATGEAIAQALEMDVSEIADRMQRMRNAVSDHNIYWWAGNLIGDLCDLRLSRNTVLKTTIDVTRRAS